MQEILGMGREERAWDSGRRGGWVQVKKGEGEKVRRAREGEKQKE